MVTRAAVKSAPGVLLGLASLLASCSPWRGERDSHAAAPTLTPVQILENLRKELIPAEGSPTLYQVSFSSDGYEILRQWNADIHPAQVWADDYERLDIRLPCCGATHPVRDETRNCGCGHHQALYGLGKGLLRRGLRVPEVQDEIGRWRAFMFPREVLLSEMERRALEDPALRQALDELRQQGVC